MKKGLYANIAAKRNRINSGSGEKMRRKGSKGAPTEEAFEKSALTAKMQAGGSVTRGCGAMMPTKRKKFTVA